MSDSTPINKDKLLFLFTKESVELLDQDFKISPKDLEAVVNVQNSLLNGNQNARDIKTLKEKHKLNGNDVYMVVRDQDGVMARVAADNGMNVMNVRDVPKMYQNSWTVALA